MLNVIALTFELVQFHTIALINHYCFISLE